MKSTTKTGLLLSFLLLFILCKVEAQNPILCNYQINSNINCTFNVQVDFYDDCSMPPCSSTIIPVSSGPNPVSCGSCGTLCNIVVTIVGGSPAVDIFNEGTPTNVSVSLCAGTVTSVTAVWQRQVCDIHL